MNDPLWDQIREEAQRQAQKEPMLASFLHAVILNHESLEDSLSFHLAQKLEGPALSALTLREVIDQSFEGKCDLSAAIRADLAAVVERDSACDNPYLPFLYFKGFHAIQAYRVAHCLWQQDRQSLALLLQNRTSMVFGVDIHPAAKIGQGIMFDHATGIVVGETCVIGDNVSIMQSVTLGGTGKDSGDRHPKVGNGVLISAGAKVLGNIKIGDSAKVGAGSVVLKDVEPHTTVAGIPAKDVGAPECDSPALQMNHSID